ARRASRGSPPTRCAANAAQRRPRPGRARRVADEARPSSTTLERRRVHTRFVASLLCSRVASLSRADASALLDSSNSWSVRPAWEPLACGAAGGEPPLVLVVQAIGPGPAP